VNATVPDWAIDILADPATRRPVDRAALREIPVDDDDGGRARGVLADLSGRTTNDIEAHSSRFANYGKEPELLRPEQVRFRRLLKRWIDDLPRDAVLVDIACAEMDFAHLAANVRYVPVDLARERLACGIELGRSPFAVIGDITSPPIQAGAVTAILCTNTLNHLDKVQIEQALSGLIPALAPGGRMLLTVPSGSQAVVHRLARVHGVRIVRAGRLGGKVSRGWARLAHRHGRFLRGLAVSATGLDADREVARLDAWLLSPLISRRPPPAGGRDEALFHLVAGA